MTAPFFQMIKYTSNSLQRDIQIDEVRDITQDEAWMLHSEIVKTITDLDEALANAVGPTYSDSWRHRVTTKRKICVVFREKLGLVLSPGRTQVEGWRQERMFRKMYDQQMQKLLLVEFTEKEVKDIFGESYSSAKSEFEAWLAENKYDASFTP